MENIIGNTYSSMDLKTLRSAHSARKRLLVTALELSLVYNLWLIITDYYGSLALQYSKEDTVHKTRLRGRATSENSA